MAVDHNTIMILTTELLRAIGEDPMRDGLKDTPRRVANFWREFIDYDSGILDTCFEQITTNQMVCVSGMRVTSLCEHHLMPFWCDISIGYIAQDKVLGLSKFARIAHKHAHGVQLQERLVHEIADEVAMVTQSADVAVMAQGRHSCMEMRGIRTLGVMTTSVMRGLFKESQNTRSEFLRLLHMADNK